MLWLWGIIRPYANVRSCGSFDGRQHQTGDLSQIVLFGSGHGDDGLVPKVTVSIQRGSILRIGSYRRLIGWEVVYCTFLSLVEAARSL